METKKVSPLDIICKAIRHILSRVFNISTHEENHLAAIRHMVTVIELKHWSQVQGEIERQIECRTTDYTEALKMAICEGMNIECGESVTLADLFALIDTSVSDRISKSLQYRNAAQDKPMGERDWRADCEELEKMIREYWNHNVYGERGNDDAVLHRESRLELIRNFDAYQKARKEA